jgi:hypothetical protein
VAPRSRGPPLGGGGELPAQYSGGVRPRSARGVPRTSATSVKLAPGLTIWETTVCRTIWLAMPGGDNETGAGERLPHDGPDRCGGQGPKRRPTAPKDVATGALWTSVSDVGHQRLADIVGEG